MQQTAGTIVTWKQDRGFGFIRPTTGGPDVFVHIRDFGAIGRAPQAGDKVTYVPMRDKEGRYRAADVIIAGLPRAPTPRRAVPSAPRPSASHLPSPARRSVPRASPRIDAPNNVRRLGLVLVVGAIVTIAITTAAYRRTVDRPVIHAVHEPKAPVTTTRPDIEVASYSCEGKRRCGEMNSCDEATFYLQNCPNTEMDGDGDGIPCERQWCR